MSRKFRLEEEKAKHIQEELQEEEDKLKQQKERIFGPLLWRTLPSGIRIIDLQSINYDQAANIILEYYVSQNVIFRNAKNFINDPDSVDSFRDKLIVSMMDRCSIIAVKEEDDEIVGILLLKAVKQADYGRVFSRCALLSGKPYASIVKFLNYINRKVDIYEQFECNIYLRYYLLCIKPEYRGKRLGLQMMLAAIDVARHLRILVIMGIFDSFQLQHNARKLGMRIYYETRYKKYHDKDEELIFCDLGAGNYTCTLMAGLVPPLPVPEPVKKVESITRPLTRAEKRQRRNPSQRQIIFPNP